MQTESVFFQIAVMGAFVIALAVVALWGDGAESNSSNSPKD